MAKKRREMDAETKEMHERLLKAGIDIPERHTEISMAMLRMRTDSPRSVGIVAASLVEEELGIAIRRFFIATPAALKKIELLRGSGGVLSTFSTLINLTWLMGCISDEAKNDLDDVRGIRNIFAHDYAVANFDHPDIKSRCERLSCAKTHSTRHPDGLLTLNLPNAAIGYTADHDPFATAQGIYEVTCTYLMHALASLEGRPHQPTPPL